jgi:hypothetical protein
MFAEQERYGYACVVDTDRNYQLQEAVFLRDLVNRSHPFISQV